MEYKFDILTTPADEELCATMMSENEPWITLKRDYDKCLENIRNPLAEKYLLRVGEEIAGFAILQMNGSFAGYIQSILMAEKYRGQGLGKHFIGFLEGRIYADQPNVFLCVSSFNTRAMELYKRLDYEQVGELKDFVVRGHSEFIMRKTIGPKSEYF
ncbi:MAG: GNAT family N-acetyltransferase [Bacteroidota bacterium]